MHFEDLVLTPSCKDWLEDAEESQYIMLALLDNLKKYNPTNLDKMKSREETLINAERLHNSRNKVIKAFENGAFPFKDGFWITESDLSDKTKLDFKQLELDKMP